MSSEIHFYIRSKTLFHNKYKLSQLIKKGRPISVGAPVGRRSYKISPGQIVVSVVLVNYNQGHYLEEALNSVINQSYSNIEIIVIDGGSTDNSKKILKKFPGIEWRSEPDNSSGHAFAKGVEIAKGEVIYFLASSDGFFDSEWISTSISLFENNKNLSLVSADVVGISQNGEINGYKWPNGKPKHWSNRDLFFNWLFKGVGVTPITFGIRKEVLKICAPDIDRMVQPKDPNSVDYFWYLIGNFFSSGYIGIKIDMISSFVRFHTDRVDDSEYLARQRSQLHRNILRRRRSLLMGRRPAIFLSPTGDVVSEENISYFRILIHYIFSKMTNLLGRLKRDPFELSD